MSLQCKQNKKRFSSFAFCHYAITHMTQDIIVIFLNRDKTFLTFISQQLKIRKKIKRNRVVEKAAAIPFIFPLTEKRKKVFPAKISNLQNPLEGAQIAP